MIVSQGRRGGREWQRAAHQYGGTTQNLTLSYKADGDCTGWSDGVSGISTTYDYDQADRRTSFTSGGIVATYAYSGAGLRVSMTGVYAFTLD